MKNGKERRLYRISMVITAMMFIGVFCPWLVYRNKTYTIIGFYCAVKNAGGISSFAGSDSFIYPAVITLTVPFAAGIVAGIKFLIQAFRGRIGIISWTVYSLEWVYMALYLSFEGYQPTIFAIGGPVLALADFLVNRFMEEYRLLTRKNRELREKERREKKERKERLSFPGKYSWRTQSLMLASVDGGKKGRVLTVLTGSAATAYTFSVLALKQTMQEIHSAEVLLLGNGLEADLKSALGIACVLDMMVIGLAVSRELSGRSSLDDRMIKFGAREGLIRLNWSIEILGCFILSVIFGITIGILELHWIVRKISDGVGEALTATITVSAIIITALIIGVIFLTTVLYCYDKAVQKRYYNLINRGNELIPSTRMSIILLTAGIVVYGAGMLLFTQRRNAENIWLYAEQILGGLMFVFAVSAVLVRKAEVKGYRRARSISRSVWTYSFRKIMGNIIVIAALVSMLAVPILQMEIMNDRIKSSADLVPYDFVAFGYKDDDEIYHQVKEYSKELHQIPMVRVTSVEGAPYNWKDVAANKFLGVLWPQGQNIGISWNSYAALCQRRGVSTGTNALAAGKILISYQQDCVQKTHPIDYYLFRKKPYLRIGQPLRYYVVPDREKLYPPRNVQTEVSQNIIGMLNRGDQENLVVFPNDYFYKNRKAEGPSFLYLINSKSGRYTDIENLLQRVAKKNQKDASFDSEIRSYYGRKQLLKDIQSERYFQKTMLMHEIIMMLICLVLVWMTYVEFIKSQSLSKYRILRKLGISEKMKRGILRREIILCGLPPILTSALLAIAYSTEMIYLRGIGAGTIQNILIRGIPYWGTMLVIQIGFLVYEYHSIYRRVTVIAGKGAAKWMQSYKQMG